MTIYRHLAEIYDHLMIHVDYPQWVDYIQDILLTLYPEKIFDRILDCSCGTASFLNLWNQASDPLLIGSDLSPDMLRIAQTKKPPIPLIRADMMDLPFRHRFNLILCLYDSFNYLLKTDDILLFLHSAEQALQPEGILIFDVTTSTNCLRYFQNEIDNSSIGSIAYQRKSHYDSQTMIQYNHFVLNLPHQVIRETHIQQVYPIRILRNTIKKSRLIPIKDYGDFSFKPGSENSERIHFILQKPPSQSQGAIQ